MVEIFEGNTEVENTKSYIHTTKLLLLEMSTSAYYIRKYFIRKLNI